MTNYRKEPEAISKYQNRYAAGERPDVTPLLTCGGAGTLGLTADGFRALLSLRGGLVRVRGRASGGFTVTAGSWADPAATAFCASAGDTMTNSDAVAENAAQTVLRNTHAPA